MKWSARVCLILSTCKTFFLDAFASLVSVQALAFAVVQFFLFALFAVVRCGIVTGSTRQFRPQLTCPISVHERLRFFSPALASEVLSLIYNPLVYSALAASVTL